jgi:tetratricopeptide (TPR) repeat protein
MIVCISACSNNLTSPLQKSRQKPLFLDEHFLGFEFVPIETEQYIFALDEEMKKMVAIELRTEKDIKKRTLKLFMNLFENKGKSISYDRNANVTAREAFHNKAANCLSLTIMAYALATQAGLKVSFQQIDIPEYWVRNGQYNLLTGHINLLVNPGRLFRKTIINEGNGLQIDFDPQASQSNFEKIIIDKNTVIAMFYNNKGAEALVDDDYISAYGYFKAAVLIAPSFSSAWSNLGVLYKLTNQRQEAKIAYRYAIDLDDGNLTAMQNLAIILFQQGNSEEAQVIKDKLHLKRSKNPYYYALLADEAFTKGQIEQAIRFYHKAIKLERRVHEFYYRLSTVYSHKGEIILAKKALTKAIAYTKNSLTEDFYTAKLDFLDNPSIID